LERLMMGERVVTQRGRLAMGGPGGKEREILDAAEKLFARYGYRKTTVGDIVREAAVARATVYKYFGSKDEIFVAALHREFREILAAVRMAIEEEATVRDQLGAALLAHMDEIRKKRIALQVTLEAWVDIMFRWKEDFQEMVSEAVEIYGGILSRGAERGEIEVENIELTTRTILLSVKGLFMGVMTGDIESDRVAILDTLLDMVFDGLAPREATA
jgi:AcrR family transcriptional regulator